MKKRYYLADFETITSTQARKLKRADQVVAWGIKASDNESFWYGINIKTFLKKVINLPQKRSKSTEIYFHNLSGFDGFFILKALEKNGFSQRKFRLSKKTKEQIVKSPFKEKNLVKKLPKWKPKNYSCLINDENKILEIKICYKNMSTKEFNYLIFKCSLLIFVNTSLELMGDMINLPKLDLVYKKLSPFKSVKSLTNSKVFNYLERDIDIQKNFFIESGKIINKNNLKLTLGATAFQNWKITSRTQIEKFYLKNYKQDWQTELSANGLFTLYFFKKKLISSTSNTERLLNKLFPLEWIDKNQEIRNWYSGGLTHLHPKKYGIKYKKVFGADIVSSYPSVMNSNLLLPFGEPFMGDGGKNYPIKLYKITAWSNLENKNGMPFVGDKKNGIYFYNKIISSTKIFYLTSAEFPNFQKYYKGDYIKNCVFSFKGVKAFEIFGSFIEKWVSKKSKAKQTGNKVSYLFSKLIMNSVYGKFATKTLRESKIFNPTNWNKKTQLEKTLELEKPSFYLPIGALITAYARQKLVSAVGSDYEKFIYADTDSIYSHIKLNLDYGSKLGQWETTFENCNFLGVGKKRYIASTKTSKKIVLASYHIKKSNYKKYSFDDLIFGLKNFQKQKKETEFGIDIIEVEKELKPVYYENYTKPDGIWFKSKKEFLAKWNL